MKNKIPFLFIVFLCVLAIQACHNFGKSSSTNNQAQLDMHSAYDDSTLTNRVLPVMMPYNRLIEPAGKVLKFGDPAVENHSLDVKLVPQTTLLAVEDRYGVTLVDTTTNKVVTRWTTNLDGRYSGLMSTYSGLQVRGSGNNVQLFWSISGAKGRVNKSYVMQAAWDGQKITIVNAFEFKAVAPSPMALPNEVLLNTENGTDYLYVVLNGNNQLVKIDLNTGNTLWTKATGVAPYGIAKAGNKLFVTNWGGDEPGADTTTRETAGIPYGKTYIDPKTGATSDGTVQVFDPQSGNVVASVNVGLHPNAVISSKDGRFIYVANANSDNVSVISVPQLNVTETIPVQLISGKNKFIGDSPNALALSTDGSLLYVANGLDNAVAVIKLGADASAGGSGKSIIKGFIPTEAYPGGLLVEGANLFVTNLEGEGSRITSKELHNDKNDDDEEASGSAATYNSHHQYATLSTIPLPNDDVLKQYTDRVKSLNLTFRQEIAKLAPRPNIAPKPIPERIGEPSIFRHVLYVIKENRTYDQVLGDMPQGNGLPSVCIYGDSITPNQHKLAKDFLLLDNYYASGKCSAEGHQWTDAAMVTDYVEKNVRAWFRSYPHVQEDALVYDQQGFIWNNAADHGKRVRIYGEASQPHYNDKLSWLDIYNDHKEGKPFKFYNTSTISRVRPMLSQNYPGSDVLKITDQIRATAFINELHGYEKQPGDALPELMVMALSDDHTEGLRAGYPKPQCMVADNDLALGRIIEALSKSRFWKNTVVFVTEDDSQGGWDHVSAYRTTGFVVSAYSNLKKTVSTNYNQTCMVRSIEQILGIPPMNIIDATALPMFNCFTNKPSNYVYQAEQNRIKLEQITPKLSALKGKTLYYARASGDKQFDHVDGGNDDLLNRILWFAAKGDKAYPAKIAGKDADDK